MKLGFLLERLNFEKISVPLITRLKVKSFFVQLPHNAAHEQTKFGRKRLGVHPTFDSTRYFFALSIRPKEWGT